MPQIITDTAELSCNQAYASGGNYTKTLFIKINLL